jgi:hypothetical protein
MFVSKGFSKFWPCCFFALFLIFACTTTPEKEISEDNSRANSDFSIEELLFTNYKFADEKSFISFMERIGFARDYSFSFVPDPKFKGVLEGKNILIRSAFENLTFDDKIVNQIVVLETEFERPNAPEERFLLFEKLSDYVSNLYGKPVYSIFEIAYEYINNYSLPGYVPKAEFKDYILKNDYKQLIIASEGLLINEGSYYKKWEWHKKDRDRHDLIGISEGSAKVILKKDGLVVHFSPLSWI